MMFVMLSKALSLRFFFEKTFLLFPEADQLTGLDVVNQTWVWIDPFSFPTPFPRMCSIIRICWKGAPGMRFSRRA